MTVDELVEEMMEWVAGRKSHWNEYADLSADDPAHRNAMCAIADAQEVVKLSAAIQALSVVE